MSDIITLATIKPYIGVAADDTAHDTLLAIIISICLGEIHLKSGTDFISANQFHFVVFLPSKQ